MSKKIDPTDIVGSTFGKLTIEEYRGRSKSRRHLYRCTCKCGKETVTERYSLLSGKTKSCGCAKQDRIDGEALVGVRFGSLTVVEYLGIQKKTEKTSPTSLFRCLCDCGNESVVKYASLADGHTQSCGHCRVPEIVFEEDYCRYNCSNGNSFIFDKIDLGIAKARTWSICDSDGSHVDSNDGKATHIFARDVLEAKEYEIVDHIDGNPRNNRRSNLRIANRAENVWNMRINSRNSTGYKGIYPDKQAKTPHYSARIRVNGKRIYLGYFTNPEEAARAYDEAARFYFGEFACVNFPLPGEQCCRRNQEAV